MADLVAQVLQAAAEKEAKYKSIEVQKDIELDIDEGNLLAVDSNPLETRTFRGNRENFLRDLTRDNTQLLLNKIWELPVERVEETVVAQLPKPRTIIPREKPIPKARRETKWSKYAQLKGIQNRKKGRMVYDEQAKEYKPRWGYKRANDPNDQWAIEVPANADPYEDQFEKLKSAKKERVAKNELQRLRNIARSKGKGKIPGVGLAPTEGDNKSKDDLGRALHLARRSDASIGKFSQTIPKEKPVKGMGKKRKFESTMQDSKVEKSRQLDILRVMDGKRSKLDEAKALSQEMAAQDQVRAQKNKAAKKGKKVAGGKLKAGAAGKKKKGLAAAGAGGKKKGGKGKGGRKK